MRAGGVNMSTSAEIKARSATRTKRRALARVSPLASVAATLACGALLLTPAVSHADQPSITAEPATSCPDIEVVFARGTGEPPGAAALAVSGKSVAVYGVEYPASDDFLHDIDGVNDAAAFIQKHGRILPADQDGVGRLLPPGCRRRGHPHRNGPADPWIPETVADHIAAVAVFGNPSNRIGDPVTALSPLYGSKAIDLCNGADTLCSTGDDIPAQVSTWKPG